MPQKKPKKINVTFMSPPLPSIEFQQLVRRELQDAKERAMALVRTHDGRTIMTDFVCKAESCQEPVVTHKGGTAGYCTVIQDNGKTHRQEYLEERKANGHPGPGAKKAGAARIEPAKVHGQATALFWLDDVRERIDAALNEVENAENDLATAKARLHEILTEAQDALK